MGLSLVTPPAIEPVTVAELRTHLRIDGTGTAEPPPDAPSVALAGAGAGNVDNGVHRYRVTFVTADGETEGGAISAPVTVADNSVDGQVAVTNIPTGGSAVTARRIYRTAAGGSDYLLATTLNDNTTTSWTDNVADASLGASAPTVNTTNDPELVNLISAARLEAEGSTRRAFITQQWDLTLDRFPAEIELPLPPARSVDQITYIDTAGTTQILDSSEYQVDLVSERARIRPAFGKNWPSTRDDLNAVTVRFTAGYGAARSDVPEPIRQAILMIAASLYENRADIAIGAPVMEIPRSSEWLLAPYRSIRF